MTGEVEWSHRQRCRSSPRLGVGLDDGGRANVGRVEVLSASVKRWRRWTPARAVTVPLPVAAPLAPQGRFGSRRCARSRWPCYGVDERLVVFEVRFLTGIGVVALDFADASLRCLGC